MILLPYFLVSAFYLKESIRHKRMPHIAIASVASIYALWLLYAAGLDLLLLSGVLYLVGLVIFQSATLSIKIAQTKSVKLIISTTVDLVQQWFSKTKFLF